MGQEQTVKVGTQTRKDGVDQPVTMKSYSNTGGYYLRLDDAKSVRVDVPGDLPKAKPINMDIRDTQRVDISIPDAGYSMVELTRVANIQYNGGDQKHFIKIYSHGLGGKFPLQGNIKTGVADDAIIAELSEHDRLNIDTGAGHDRLWIWVNDARVLPNIRVTVRDDGALLLNGSVLKGLDSISYNRSEIKVADIMKLKPNNTPLDDIARTLAAKTTLP